MGNAINSVAESGGIGGNLGIEKLGIGNLGIGTRIINRIDNVKNKLFENPKSKRSFLSEDKLLLMISGYTRSFKSNSSFPKVLISLIFRFYANRIEFEGNVFDLTVEEKELITSWFIDLYNLKHESNDCISSTLLYDYNKDNQDPKKAGTEFHKKCNKAPNTFTIIESQFNGHLFGGFYSKPLSDKYGVCHDDKVFLCIIRSGFKTEKDSKDEMDNMDIVKPGIFRPKDNKCKYNNHDECGPTFGSGFDLSVMDYYEKCNYVNHSFDDYTGLKGNMLCGGQKLQLENQRYQFKIKKMMTFSIDIEQNK